MKILHCIHEPSGGIFRHVGDLAEMQAAAGHEVGLVCDVANGSRFEAARLAALEPFFALGVHRFAMPRDIAPSDIGLVRRAGGVVRTIQPDVMHAHGSKAGAYARLAATLLGQRGKRPLRIYTPHGGSLHFDASSSRGRVLFAAERTLMAMTDGFLFVSQYESKTFTQKVGEQKPPTAVVLNGLRPDEFDPVATAPDARDFVFVGELRELKGADVLLRALRLLRHQGKASTAFIVGDGPDKPSLQALANELDLTEGVTFLEAMPARTAFRLAKVMVVPSRKESLPYIVLEAAGAGIPLVATRTGGVHEIFGPEASRLVVPDDDEALASGMTAAVSNLDKARGRAIALKDYVFERFPMKAMGAGVLDLYAKAGR